jgi:hypothetical protein
MSWAAANRAAHGRRERSYLVVWARPRTQRCDVPSGQGLMPLTAVRGVFDYADAEAHSRRYANLRKQSYVQARPKFPINHLGIC